VEVRIGVTQTPKEIDVELDESSDPEHVRKLVEDAVGSESGVLWLTDRKGRTVGVPSAKIAYVEISPVEERRVGFSVT
jgi:hypothetical protein